MKTKILADFQIYISVPLEMHILTLLLMNRSSIYPSNSNILLIIPKLTKKPPGCALKKRCSFLPADVNILVDFLVLEE